MIKLFGLLTLALVVGLVAISHPLPHWFSVTLRPWRASSRTSLPSWVRVEFSQKLLAVS
jgi:hypothetical protein